MKRRLKYLNKQSVQGKCIAACDRLFLQILIAERGDRCELHNGNCRGAVGRFHILDIGMHPRLRYSRENVLLACWFGGSGRAGHYHWHHDPFRKEEIEREIKRLRGENYKDKLLILERAMPRLTLFYLKTLKMAFTQELKKLEDKR